MQIEEHPALVVDGGLRGVEILGLLAGGERASAEGDDGGLLAVDGEHETAAKAVEEAGAFRALQHQARGLHLLGGEPFLLERAGQQLAEGSA